MNIRRYLGVSLVYILPILATFISVTSGHFDLSEVENAINTAAASVKNRLENADSRQKKGIHAPSEAEGSNVWHKAHKPVSRALNISSIALIAEETTKQLVTSHHMDKSEVGSEMPGVDLSGTVLGQYCPVANQRTCQPHKYRSLDGFCNNVQRASWGSAHTAFSRLLPPVYEDGLSSPRLTSSSHQKPPLKLPSAADLSDKVLTRSLTPSSGDTGKHQYVTAVMAVWAQLIYHDLVHVPLTLDGKNHQLDCCSRSSLDDDRCFPIIKSPSLSLSSSSSSPSSFNNCQSYARSLPSLHEGCHLGPREMMNMATSYIDASSLYSTSESQLQLIRTFSGGQLHVRPASAGKQKSADDVTVCLPSSRICPPGGDTRTHEHAGISAIYILLRREHNRLAREMSSINPHWSDEMVFQEARRLLIAQIQHITYREFLPVALGKPVAEFFNLDLLSAGFYQNYTLDESPLITNAAAVAALKFYMALLPSTIKHSDYDGSALKEEPLSASFFRPDEVLAADNNVDHVLLGLTDNMAATGSSINQLFTNMFGTDLAAEVIQQGRDHALPPYTEWRRLCGLSQVSTFQQLNASIPAERVQLLANIYSSVSDIDLFVGGLLESPLEGAVIGPTFACVLGQQFVAARRSDRFWFENDVPPSAFTKEQLYQIRKSSISLLLCNNIEELQQLPPNVFMKQDPYLNAPVLCGMLPNIDLYPWQAHRSGMLIPQAMLRDAIDKAKIYLERRRSDERILYELDLKADPKSAMGTAYAFSRPNRQAIVYSNTSLILEYASEEFMSSAFKSGNSRFKRQLVRLSNQLDSNSQTIQGVSDTLRQFDVSSLVSQVPIIDQCRADEETVPCDPSSPYRTYSGYCNNLRNPNNGKSVTPQHRLLPAQYDDGISRPRQLSVQGSVLPSPRLISTALHDDVSNPHSRYTMFLMQYGQFLDHDISLTPLNKGFGDSILNCRDCDSANRVHPECWPISVPANDPYFPPVNVSNGRPFCIAFTRSLPGQQTLGAREQINQNTAYLDASHIYGQDQCEARVLRHFTDGTMVMTPHPVRGKGLLPTTRDNKECRAPSGSCFAAGDSRSSEQAGLAALHIIWIREHNRISKELRSINSHWDDEKIYQVARKIVGAVWEHITYNEFLPRILGWNAMQLYDLRVGTEGFFKGYDETCSAAVLNEFSSAAFRFGHSLIRPNIFRMDQRFGDRNPHIRLRDSFFNSDMLFDAQMVDDIMRGLVNTPMENLDNYITDEVTKHLFEERGHPFSGLDLVSLNIQRARDHGLRPYNDYRAICNLKKAETFDDLSREIPQRLISKMKQVYAHVNDVDLFTGGLSETPLQGGLVGPTFGCIIGLQFRFLKKCDRYWYETEDPAIRFTEPQLSEIRKVTMAHIMCENCDEVDLIQRALFDMPHDFLNPRIPCRSMARLNLQLWRDGSGGARGPAGAESGQCTVNGVSISRGTTVSISPCTRCSCRGGAGGQQTSCQSVRVASCRQLTREQILADTACRVQCLAELPPDGASVGGVTRRPVGQLSPPARPNPRPQPVLRPVGRPLQPTGFQPSRPVRPVLRPAPPFGLANFGLQGLGRLFGI